MKGLLLDFEQWNRFGLHQPAGKNGQQRQTAERTGEHGDISGFPFIQPFHQPAEAERTEHETNHAAGMHKGFLDRRELHVFHIGEHLHL